MVARLAGRAWACGGSVRFQRVFTTCRQFHATRILHESGGSFMLGAGKPRICWHPAFGRRRVDLEWRPRRNTMIDHKARAEAAFSGQKPTATPSSVEQAADAAQAKIARLKALREAREKAEADRMEIARQKARRAREERNRG
ncbi:hypothetical protein [Aquabacter cavernae]|uniref:hypothetical protein n=1 Tax=Aquabacter cavernae TaxID=2496029 RepID=UPI000F8D01C5|nr:hypothetical protein [Aquabacter cavernae]